MQRRNLQTILVAICLATPFGSLATAQARQAPPSADGMAVAIQKRQAEAMKRDYGFTDAQTKAYFLKESKINKDTQTRLTILRKELVATKNKEVRRRIATQMRDAVTGSDKKMQAALESVATPMQRRKMSMHP